MIKVGEHVTLDIIGTKKGYKPSFFEALPNVFETKIDNLIGSSRTEYHCKKCGGHHGHIFEDGPKPTGRRYCNNGLCLVFVPKKK